MQDRYLKLYRKSVFIAQQIDALVSGPRPIDGENQPEHSIFDDEVIAEINRIKPVVSEFEILRSKKFELIDKLH